MCPIVLEESKMLGKYLGKKEIATYSFLYYVSESKAIIFWFCRCCVAEHQTYAQKDRDDENREIKKTGGELPRENIICFYNHISLTELCCDFPMIVMRNKSQPFELAGGAQHNWVWVKPCWFVLWDVCGWFCFYIMKSSGETPADGWGRLIRTVVVFLRNASKRAWTWESKKEEGINLKVCLLW